MPSRRTLIAAGIWIVGWAIAIPIYLLATPPEEDPLYDYKHSKSYEYGVERFGGKAALFGQELTDWVTSLFTGPMLGVTIAVISMMASLGYLLWTRPRNQERPRPASP